MLIGEPRLAHGAQICSHSSTCVVHVWRRFRDRTINRAMLQVAMGPVRATFHTLLVQRTRRWSASDGMDQALLDHEDTRSGRLPARSGSI
ncbi:hypothetical protein Rcas_0536 [Roseiflexus castenholzii DSM 13941]|uniref:Uncharacterized protein n=1 Tax=Roseiflexus castenholzii (strain DSM 13941 / HLO8) TaxID=383372 RepID=A7NF82_ROSCS|nr:hypothetical protein Rcas_0536 [Roseiflexus castenholzii DSM 13941]